MKKKKLLNVATLLLRQRNLYKAMLQELSEMLEISNRQHEEQLAAILEKLGKTNG